MKMIDQILKCFTALKELVHGYAFGKNNLMSWFPYPVVGKTSGGELFVGEVAVGMSLKTLPFTLRLYVELARCVLQSN